MKTNGIVSGPCTVCGQMVYVEEKLFEMNGNIHIHWSCNPANEEVILRDNIILAVRNMNLTQLKSIEKAIFNK